MARTCYRQRASVGLIVSEATQISAMGKGYLDTPGIYEPSHVDAWKKIVEAVHAAGGRIFCQLWHVVRISHTSLLPDGSSPVAPSAIQARSQTFTEDSDRESLFTQVYTYLDDQAFAYLPVVEQFPGTDNDSAQQQLLKSLRSLYHGVYIGNGGYEADTASKVIAEGQADVITFGRPFIANPDLPERFRIGATLNEADSDTFHGGGEAGYTDYPFFDRH